MEITRALPAWSLRYAPHLGFPTMATPWLRNIAASNDPVVQIASASELGFAGIVDKDLVLRSHADQTRIGQALRRYRLSPGSYVEAPNKPLSFWNSLDPYEVKNLHQVLSHALEAGARVGAAELVVTSAHDAGRPAAEQMAIFADHLNGWAIRDAEKAGIRLCVEAISPARLAGALITRTSQAVAISEMTGGKVGIVFDTVHVAAEGDDLEDTFLDARQSVAVIQLADMPGRIPPGAGILNLKSFLATVSKAGYQGLVELEHQHLTNDEAGEHQSLGLLEALDPR